MELCNALLRMLLVDIRSYLLTVLSVTLMLGCFLLLRAMIRGYRPDQVRVYPRRIDRFIHF